MTFGDVSQSPGQIYFDYYSLFLAVNKLACKVKAQADSQPSWNHIHQLYQEGQELETLYQLESGLLFDVQGDSQTNYALGGNTVGSSQAVINTADAIAALRRLYQVTTSIMRTTKTIKQLATKGANEISMHAAGTGMEGAPHIPSPSPSPAGPSTYFGDDERIVRNILKEIQGLLQSQSELLNEAVWYGNLFTQSLGKGVYGAGSDNILRPKIQYGAESGQVFTPELQLLAVAPDQNELNYSNFNLFGNHLEPTKGSGAIGISMESTGYIALLDANTVTKNHVFNWFNSGDPNVARTQTSGSATRMGLVQESELALTMIGQVQSSIMTAINELTALENTERRNIKSRALEYYNALQRVALYCKNMGKQSYTAWDKRDVPGWMC